MPYTAQDELFLHQLPRTFDQVSDSERTFSDRCYFNCHSPEGDFLLVSGYGNNPNAGFGHGYFKIALADGRHIDLDVSRELVGDRDKNFAGPITWTCVEPLKTWRIQIAPNESGVEADLTYSVRTPFWELKPIVIRREGRLVTDFQHLKQSGTWQGWVKYDGETRSVDGYSGGRDRTMGVRVSDQIDFWIWYSAELPNRSIEAWLIEGADSTVEYVDGGFTYENGDLSKARFVRLDHDIEFDGDRKRPLKAELRFMDDEGTRHNVNAESIHPEVVVYYGVHNGKALPRKGDAKFNWFSWNSLNEEELAIVEDGALALDQLMRHELNGEHGFGIFELYAARDPYERYPNLKYNGGPLR